MGYFTEEDVKEINRLKKDDRPAARRGKKLRPFRDLGALGKVWRVIWCLVLIIAILAVLLIGTLTIFEFRPAEVEDVTINGNGTKTISVGDEISVVTWNVGYGALGDNADFFMDGGSSVKTADKARVLENLEGIQEELLSLDADVNFLQEVDTSSYRSSFINEAEFIADALGDVDTAFAYNFRCLFIPYPIPPIGTVNGGILTTSKYDVTSSERVSLPCPFSWPVSIGNLKRCLDVSRVDVEGTDKELVLVNLHLEAYDDGEGKEAQTKMLRELLEEETAKGNYVIAAGDFNQTFSDVDLTDYPTYEGMWAPGIMNASDFSGFQTLMDNSEPSCRSLDQVYAGADHDNFQFYVIDGYIVSPNIQVEYVETQNMEFTYSDHNPVLLRAVLK